MDSLAKDHVGPPENVASSQSLSTSLRSSSLIEVAVSVPLAPAPVGRIVGPVVGEKVRERQVRLEEAAVEQAEHRRQQTLRRAQALWESSGVPPRYFHARLDGMANVPSDYETLAKQLLIVLESPGVYALIGPRGTGKTYLGCALIRRSCAVGKSAKYLRTLDLFRTIRSTWGNTRRSINEAALFGDLTRHELLIIDEIQVRGESDWENSTLTDVIDARYAHLKSTLLLSNLESAALAANVGESITSRLLETGKVFQALSPTFRKPGREQPHPPKLDGNNNPIFPPVSTP